MMLIAALLPPLAVSPLDGIRENWGKTTIPVTWTVVGLGLLVAAVGGVAVVSWYRQRHQRARPLAVFHELAAVGGLTPGDRWLLWRIARQQALPGPATLLMSTQTLRVHGVAFARQGLAWRKAARLRRIATIRRALLTRGRR